MFWRRKDRSAPPETRDGIGDTDLGVLAPFVCPSCGRTDLPATGDWDPPICLECDAAINFDAEREHEWHEEVADAEAAWDEVLS